MAPFANPKNYVALKNPCPVKPCAFLKGISVTFIRMSEVRNDGNTMNGTEGWNHRL